MTTNASEALPASASTSDAAPSGPRPGEPQAIFIVGVPRSGTTMMREILERSDRIAIARENHFVGHVRRTEGARYYFRTAGDLSDDDAIRRIIGMIYDGEFQRRSRVREISTFWKWLPMHVERSDMERRLLAAERTERGIFEAFMRAYADTVGRPLIGEKTPAHLSYVDTLLEWFPRARVVHMIRDPRAVYVSDVRRRRQKPRKPYSWLMKVPGLLQLVILAQTVLVWRGAVRLHGRYASRYPDQYLLVRFEDVVQQPQQKVREIFEFLGVQEPSDATDVRVVSQGFNRGEQGMDAGAASRWRDHIKPLPRRVLSLMLRGPMRAAGYPD